MPYHSSIVNGTRPYKSNYIGTRIEFPVFCNHAVNSNQISVIEQLAKVVLMVKR